MENIKLMTNAELNLKMKALNDEYEVTKTKILALTERMKELDKKYAQYQTEYNKRTSGNIWMR